MCDVSDGAVLRHASKIVSGVVAKIDMDLLYVVPVEQPLDGGPGALATLECAVRDHESGEVSAFAVRVGIDRMECDGAELAIYLSADVH